MRIYAEPGLFPLPSVVILEQHLWCCSLLDAVVSLDPSRDLLHLPCGIMLIIYSTSVKHAQALELYTCQTGSQL